MKLKANIQTNIFNFLEFKKITTAYRNKINKNFQRLEDKIAPLKVEICEMKNNEINYKFEITLHNLKVEEKKLKAKSVNENRMTTRELIWQINNLK